MRKLLSVLLSAAIVCALAAPSAGAAEDAPSAWAAEEVAEAVALGFVPDDLQGDYQADITRAEFAKIALFFMAMQYGYKTSYTLDGVTTYDIGNFLSNYGERRANGAPEPFDDTDNAYVLRARQFGLVGGRSERIFDPDGLITRQEAAAMLLRTYQAYGGEALAEESTEPLESKFSDAGDIQHWARDGVRNLWALGVMGGVSGDRFAPESRYTREMCITTFLRLYQKAPISRLQENITPLIPFKDAVGSVTKSPNYKVLQRLDTEACTVLYVGFPSAPRAMTQLLLVYPSGETREILMRFIPADNPDWNVAPALKNLILSADGGRLSFVAVYSQREDLDEVRYELDMNSLSLAVTK